jgi:tripartite-type tricarboxylate transporter receptor subunit TctC
MRVLWFLSLAASILAAGSAAAQEYPSRTITIVVANASGDNADLSARILAPELSRILGQPVIVENKPGAGGLVGAEYVARTAPADGYTIADISVNALLILPVTVKDMRFDPIKDLPPFVNLIASKLMLAIPAAQPWKSFNDLVAAAKANPGTFNYGSSSSTTRLLTEWILHDRGLDVVYIPFSNTAANMLSMTRGDTHMGITSEPQVIGASGGLRVLAQTGEKRSANFPDVPVFGEVGFPDMPGASYTFNLRAGTPKPIVDKLYAATVQAMQQPSVRAAFEKLAVEVVPSTSPDAVVKSQELLAKKYAELAKQIGLERQ